MKTLSRIRLDDVRSVYGGPEGDLWELIMGEQVHLGGFASSRDLAAAGGISAGMAGVDLCCCTGAGMRFLCRFEGVGSMIGVDATEKMVRLGKERCDRQGWGDRIRFVMADASATGMPDSCVDFVWGEDAWCYVEDKAALITEAVRLTKSGGVIAFTDWVEGRGLFESEAERCLAFMKFPSILTLEEYADLLRKNGCDVMVARDTGRFAPCASLYLDMLRRQLAGDALRVIGYDMDRMKMLEDELDAVRLLAEQGKIAQGMVVARKR